MDFMKKVVLVLGLLLFLGFGSGMAQPQAGSFKREFRGVWIASVVNIDWPSQPGLGAEAQQRELIQLLDIHQKAGINVVFFQVRPSADALYTKSREPWSRFLSGQEGKAPQPLYDPLSFAIDEAHRRGMELHAWINPYRATFDLNPDHISAGHISKKHPEWLFNYGGKKLFNPGIPEVRAYIYEVVMDLVRQYDIDGIHLDDYFYPYPDGKPIPDWATFRKYGSGFDSIEDWRRDNVNRLIETLNVGIHSEKAYVKFGVSPFGIWENKAQHPLGSESSGFSGYRQLYADARKWAEEGWVDYLIPQVYFPFGYSAAAFENLVDWWGAHAYGRHMYIGHAVYRATERRNGWENPEQLPRQVSYIRQNPHIQGSVYFSSKSLVQNLGNFRSALENRFYKDKSLPPTMPWLDAEAPSPPRGLTLRPGRSRSVVLHWQQAPMQQTEEHVYGYAIYRFESGEEIDLENASNLLFYFYDGIQTTYTDDTVESGKSYTYVVTALDRLKNESLGSNASTILIH